MSLRQPMRCARPALQAARRYAPRTSARMYATGPSQPSSVSTLAKLGAVGAFGGFCLAFASGYFSRPDGRTKLDGVPVPESGVPDGEVWEPLHAREMDDPKVCGNVDFARFPDLGLFLGMGLLLRGHLGIFFDGHVLVCADTCVQNPMRIRMATWVTNLQDHIVKTLETLEAAAPPDGEHDAQVFLRDHWIRPTGGEGSSCVLQGGRVFEKAGVNVSIVEGKLPKGAQAQMKADHDSIPVSDEPLPYFATGLSIVIHPRSPHVPTVHLNYRYFELADPKNPEKPLAWWFGGGSDLTPNYLYPEDAVLFHQKLKEACDKHNPNYYPDFKKWCDEYFFIPHRGESRGIGGVFFDDLTSSSAIHAKDGAQQPSRDEIFEFVKDCSSSFLKAYVPIVQRRVAQPYTDDERRWQLVRRGRYAEFNLLYDRGTKFGLNIPGARVESILMSLPEVARWEYMCPIGKEGSGTREEELQKVLKRPREWIE